MMRRRRSPRSASLNCLFGVCTMIVCVCERVFFVVRKRASGRAYADACVSICACKIYNKCRIAVQFAWFWLSLFFINATFISLPQITTQHERSNDNKKLKPEYQMPEQRLDHFHDCFCFMSWLKSNRMFLKDFKQWTVRTKISYSLCTQIRAHIHTHAHMLSIFIRWFCVNYHQPPWMRRMTLLPAARMPFEMDHFECVWKRLHTVRRKALFISAPVCAWQS